MANAKRASMREGPLAALFRKTEDAEGSQERPGAPDEPVASRPASEAGGSAPATHPRESGLPHPALSGSPLAEPADETYVPSPQERLRHAFSSEIPENVMERPLSGRALMDDYARAHTLPASAPRAGRPAGDPRRGRRRRGRQRGQPHGRGGGRGHRVRGRQHRRAVVAAVDRRHHAAHRSRARRAVWDLARTRTSAARRRWRTTIA